MKDIINLGENLDKRQEFLDKREFALVDVLAVQNEHLEKLWKGYVVLGIVNDGEPDSINILLQKDFRMELEVLDNRLTLINQQPQNKSEEFLLRDELEKYVSDCLTLTQRRWQTMILYKNLWRKERIELRQKELNLIQKGYAELEKKTDQLEWKTKVDSVFQEHKELVFEQEKRLTAEELLQDEFEFIYQTREKLLEIAIKLHSL